ncbi:DUF1365 domain-containing protein [Aestuariibacter sp. A3R04]|uniref:DUF1365 domain-containing protein n=1 Tax=Aestuariibacter sp. A3R04 TaxID=2841571 RepID=UPI001C09ADB2|nr:DUF1365 domain-containing protein [Aestuariibacter sp. A3R04]MBU3021907.1 DUF1365 domain-containing protein [Aestuariibacter sp. A3R04]
MSKLESALYYGRVFHQRYLPVQHKFSYDIYLFWLKLSEIPQLEASLSRFSVNKANYVSFRPKDYLNNPALPLNEAVINKMSELHGAPLHGEIFLLGQVRTLGIYFSPVNFFFLRTAEGAFTHMLAEVSNTPWNERHYYLVDLAVQADTAKAFHVSPFNPMEMTYKWHIKMPCDSFTMTLDCHRENKEFRAGLNMKRISLTNRNLNRMLKRIPSMTIKTVVGIYWQALILFVKRTPVYGHPKSQGNQ